MLVAICGLTSVPASVQGHEYSYEGLLISDTDFSSLAKLEFSQGECQSYEPISCITAAEEKPKTSYESTGVYISHCGDRAKVLAATKPCYPQLARLAHASGLVPVMVVANQEGEVIWAKALDGSPLLWPSVLRAACKWRFEKRRCVVNRIISFNFLS